MQIRLSYKLFGAFFLILAIVVGAIFLSRYIFFLNFKNYIQQVDLERLENLVPMLQKIYRTDGSWKAIAKDPQRWLQLMHITPGMGKPDPPPQLDMALPNTPLPPVKHEQPPPIDGRHYDGPPRILLTDADNQPVIGQFGPDEQVDDQRRMVAIKVDGRTVGWLGLLRHEPFKSGPPAALLQRQNQQIYLLSAAVIGLTALIAFLFSQHLLKPIQSLIQGTRDLADRNFSVRITPTTRDELGQLAKNFNEMAVTLENYENIRQQWLTDISHELRTPLAVLRGEIEALQDGIRDPTPKNLDSLHTEILRISRLVADLHLLSLADSDRLFLNKRPICPYRVLESIVKSYKIRFEQHNIKTVFLFDTVKEVYIKGDADRLGQVFTNILENVCRYVRPPGTLKILGQAKNLFLTFLFQDSGPGVPEASLPRLFDRLYRVDASRSRKSGGSGLGLSICRHIVENHDGEIWAEKNSMTGLTIGIRLPLHKIENQPSRISNGR